MKKSIITAVLCTAIFITLTAAPSFSASVRAERNTYFIEDAEGHALIQDGKKQKAREEAKRMAYRDAIEKAMEMFAGSPDSEMRNKVFARAQSMVKNFRITSETVSGDTLFITGSCSVGERAFDGVLGPEVISMLGNPRVMIVVDEESGKNASLVESELLSIFEKAGYLIVDRDQAQTLLALDPKKAFSDPELLAGAAKTIRADIIIVASVSSGARHTQLYGVNMYKPSASVKLKAVLTKTAYQISSSTVSKGSGKWGGSSSAAGLLRSGLKQAAEEIIYKIAYRMASAGSALGGITVNIKLAGASFKDIENFTAYLKKTGQVFERSYSPEMSEIDLVSSKNARNVASLISDYSLPGGNIEIDGLTAQTVSAKVKPAAPKNPDAKPIQYVVINIFLDKLDEDDAHRIEYELRKFVGTVAQVQGDYQDSKLTMEVKFVQDAEGAKNVRDIEAFLKNDMKSRGIELLVDKPEGNSIKGSRPGGILDRVWW